MNEANTPGQEFTELYHILQRLRRECPWDRKQTAESLRRYILEEAYEVIDAVDNSDWSELAGELGDLLLQIVFQSVVAEEKGYFRLDDVLNRINQKMIERHPHVFGQVRADTAEEVADNWENIKLLKEKRHSLLGNIPENTPALLRAQRIQEKASRVGFDWKKTDDVIDKIDEEISELRTALQNNRIRDVQEEFGDLLFSLVNLSRFLGIVSEDALRLSTKKFINRFEKLENYYENDHQRIKSATLEELDRIWEEIKDRSGE